MKYLYTFFFISILLAACGDEDRGSNTDQTSGTIIESNAPTLGHDAWNISEQPELTFGTDEGEEFLQFYRVFSVIELSNATIVVSNSGTHELRLFDGDGNFIKATGQNGRGPGDFGDWSSMRLYKNDAGSFIVNDNSNDRIQVFSNDGELIKVNTLEKIEEAGNPSIVDILSDKSWLIWSTVGPSALVGEPGDIIEMELGFHRLAADWSYDKMLFKLPARPRYVNQYQGVTNYPYIPLTSDPVYIAGPRNGVLFSEGSDPVITRVDTSGTYTHSFKWDLRRTKTDNIWERYKQEYYLNPLSGNPDRKAQYEHLLSQNLPIPENTPAISELKMDTKGNTWSQRFAVPWSEANTWDILNLDGNWLTTIQIPKNFTITEIGSNYILGYTNKNGFTEIVKYPLYKNS
jgi:hypothetical protein